MSHVVVGMLPAKVAGENPEVWKVSESELPKFRKALKARGVVQKDTTQGKWFDRWMNDYHGSDAAYKHGIDPKTYGQGDLVFGLESGGGYDLMLRKNQDGDYLLVFDNWGTSGAVGAIGKHAELLYDTFDQIGKIESQGLTVPEGANAKAISTCYGMLDLMAEQGLICSSDLTLSEEGSILINASPSETLLIQAGY